MIKMIPDLLNTGEIKFILTNRFNQDVLEQHFGKQRSKLGGVENPTVGQYGDSEKRFQAAQDESVRGPRTGNVSWKRNARQLDINDTTPMAKRTKPNKPEDFFFRQQ